MKSYFIVCSFIHLLGTILGLLTGLILLMYRERHAHNKLLGISFILLSLGLLTSFLIQTHLVPKALYLHFISNILCLTFMPFSYLYVRSVVKQQRPGWRDMVHGIPVLLFIIDHILYYSLSGEKRESIYHENYHDIYNLVSFTEGWFFLGRFHVIFRIAWYFLYWILQVKLIMGLFQSRNLKFSSENALWFRWLILYTAVQFFLFFPSFLVLMVGANSILWLSLQVFAGLTLIMESIGLFFEPEILYGLKEEMSVNPAVITSPKQETAIARKQHEDNHHNHNLDEEKIEAIHTRLNNLMESQSPYLKHGYSLQFLANDLNMPAYQVSAYLNRKTGMNFHDYLNQQRIQYCRDKIKKGEWLNLTLEAMAHECGFNNRNSFTSSFKKFTGITPSDYVRTARG